jgi:transcriptional regulator with XRE-family HTH domain
VHPGNINILKVMRGQVNGRPQATSAARAKTRPSKKAPALNGDPRKWMESLGDLIHQARANRYTIDQLARRSGVSTGRISQIERGFGNPSFVTLSKIATALEIPIGSFFQGPSAEAHMLVRKKERKQLVIPHDNLVYELLTPDLQGTLEVYLFHLPPGFDNSKRPITHRGEECIHVLSGSLEAFVDGDWFVLDEGDSITYDSGRPHCVRNLSDKKVTAMAAVTPPSF